MSTLREAAQQALEACADVVVGWESLAPLAVRRAAVESLDALRAALAESVQEPVAWISKEKSLLSWDKFYPDMTPLYVTPPQRKPLTHGEIREMFFAELRALPPYPSAIEELPERFARAIERAHGIGGQE